MIQNVQGSGMTPAPTALKKTPQVQNLEGSPRSDTRPIKDSVSLGNNDDSMAVYSRDMVASSSITDINVQLRDYVVSLLEEQGVAVKFSTEEGGQEIDFRTMTPEQAQELISEDGYFGVEKTSDRIVEFAINAAGADPSKLDQIKAAVLDGFKQAEEAFGGTLADISYDTLDAIMEKLDKWAEEATGTAPASQAEGEQDTEAASA